MDSPSSRIRRRFPETWLGPGGLNPHAARSRRTRGGRPGIAQLVLWLASAVPLAALNPDRPADSYSMHGWFTEDGLPSNKVRAVTQASDGYLWLATAHGISRFDGSRFTNFTSVTNPELRGGGFFAALETPDGALWFGGDTGLFRWREGRFEHFNTEHGLAHNYVRALALARDGALVACTREGYSFIRGAEITTPGGVWKRPTGVARTYLERADGTSLLGTDDGLWQISGENIERLSGKGGLPASGFLSLVETPDRVLWIGHSRGVRCVRPDGTQEDYGVAQGLTAPRVAALRHDSDGNLWIATYSGLFRLSKGRIEAATYPEQGGASTIQHLWEDREGAFWVASATGLYRLRDNICSTIGPPDGLTQASVHAVRETADGAWWVGLWGGGVFRYEQGRAVRLNAPANAVLDQTNAFAEEPDGTLWIGAASGLYRRQGETIVNLYSAADAPAWQRLHAENPHEALPGLAHNLVSSIALDGEGGLWAATDGALYEGKPGRFRLHTTANGLLGNICKSVLRARNGDVWVTTPPHGVACFRAGQWTAYAVKDAISEASPRGIYEDSAGTIWITTEGGGLNRFKDGRWRVFTRQDGLADDFISSIVEDEAGYLWIAFPRGLMRVPRSEFGEIDAGRRSTLRLRIFDQADGLPAGEVNRGGSPSAWRTRDGRLLFATDRGVAVVQPRAVKLDERKPPIHIERLVVNGRDLPLSGAVKIPPGSNDIHFYYTAISLLAPERLRFKIRLAPLDAGWVDMGDRRDIRYAKLPPGEYSFRVIASNHDGVWAEHGTTLALVVHPRFYQTTWFIALTAVAFAGLVGGAYWARVRWTRRQMALLEKLISERTRELQIAREAAVREKTRLQFIFESVPVGISLCRVQSTGAIDRMINTAHLEICGFTPAQAEDPENFTRINDPEDLGRQAALMRQLEAGEISQFSLEKRYRRLDGRVVWVVFSLQRCRYSDGSYEDLTTIVDITALKQAQEETARERARFKSIFEAVPIGLSLVYPDDERTRLVNPAHERITGVPASDSLQSAAFARVSHPDDYRRQQELCRRFLAGEIDHYSLEKRYLRPDGGVVWAVLTSHMSTDLATGERQTITTLVDITERKEAEAKLRETHRQLMEAAREAGMAEVATGVLHNVGNVLNSVNVSNSVLIDLVRRSRVDRVAKLGEMLLEQQSNLPRFFAEDSRAKQVPVFLQSLGSHLIHEQGTLLKELDSLHKNIEHIKDIVSMQQSYARIAGVSEAVEIIDLVEDALRMNAGAFVRHDVEVVRDFRARMTVTVDKHKVLQILVNLLRNAKYACDDSGRTDKRITLEVSADADWVRIAVVDNGVGIPPENLTRIFSHGFTTRKHGHGFGLHSGALAAKELGGSLMASSEGVGHGATFILELPHHAPALAEKENPAPGQAMPAGVS